MEKIKFGNNLFINIDFDSGEINKLYISNNKNVDYKYEQNIEKLSCRITAYKIGEFESKYEIKGESIYKPKIIKGLTKSLFEGLLLMDRIKYKYFQKMVLIEVLDEKEGYLPLYAYHFKTNRSKGLELFNIVDLNNFSFKYENIITEFTYPYSFTRTNETPKNPYIIPIRKQLIEKELEKEKREKKKQLKTGYLTVRDKFKAEIGKDFIKVEKVILQVFNTIYYPKNTETVEFINYFQTAYKFSIAIQKLFPLIKNDKIKLNALIFDKKNSKNGKALAYYSKSNKTITININKYIERDNDEKLMTMFHEFGHHIDDSILMKTKENRELRKNMVTLLRRENFVAKLRELKRKEEKFAHQFPRQNNNIAYYKYRLQADELIADIFGYYFTTKLNLKYKGDFDIQKSSEILLNYLKHFKL